MTPRERVGISEFRVACSPTVLITYGLGSCVGIALYDPAEKIGGLAHTLLPGGRPAGEASRESKYVDRAVVLMMARMLDMGAARDRLTAKIIGGATMFQQIGRTSAGSIGDRNVEAARRVLGELEIPLLAEDVGGRHGRTAVLDLDSGSVEVRSVRRPGGTILL